MGVASAIILIIITLFCTFTGPQWFGEIHSLSTNIGLQIVPPLGVFAVAGCGVDLFINICLTILGYVPALSFLECDWFLLQFANTVT